MVLAKKHLAAYVFFSYVLSFLLQGIMILANSQGAFLFDTPLGSLIYVLSTLMPTVVACIILLKYKYISNAKELLKITFNFKEKPRYYLLVLGFVFLQNIFVALTIPISSGTKLYMPLMMLIPCIFDGGLEELGWRYLLGPTLESRMNFTVATLLTAIVWIFWHSLHFFIDGTAQSKMSFILFCFVVLGASFALATIYRITKNIWLCILYHATINAMSFFWPIGATWLPTVLSTVATITVSIIAIKYHKKGKI